MQHLVLGLTAVRMLNCVRETPLSQAPCAVDRSFVFDENLDFSRHKKSCSDVIFEYSLDRSMDVKA